MSRCFPRPWSVSVGWEGRARGLIPIFDKLALSQVSASPLLGITIRTVGVAVIALPLAAAFGKGLGDVRAVPPAAIARFVASGVASLFLAQYSKALVARQE